MKALISDLEEAIDWRGPARPKITHDPKPEVSERKVESVLRAIWSKQHNSAYFLLSRMSYGDEVQVELRNRGQKKVLHTTWGLIKSLLKKKKIVLRDGSDSSRPFTTRFQMP